MFESEKNMVYSLAKKAFDLGFVSAAEGNFSVRIENKDLFAITPSAVEYDRMVVDDVVVLDFDGNVVDGSRKPSSEWRLHSLIYQKRSDVKAVVHTHSLFASVLSVMGEDIPVIIDEQIIYVRGVVRVSRYAMTGTWDLAEAVVEALGDHRAALIKNHGLVAVGESPEVALNVAVVAEKLAKIYYLAKVGGKVDLVPGDVVEKLKGFRYGRY